MSVVPQPLERVAFIHIPKTGGITFREAIRRSFPHSFRYCESQDPETIESELREIGCVELHRCVVDGNERYTHELLMEPDQRQVLRQAVVFSIFREPVDHYLSLFAWTLYEREKTEPVFVRRGIPFPETLEAFLAISGGNHALAGFLGRWQGDGSKPMTRDDLEEAKNIIEDLDVVAGTLESFEDFFHEFRRRTGSTVKLSEIGVLNRNPIRKRGRVDAKLQRTILEHNKLDAELYDFVRRRRLGSGPNPSAVRAEG